MIASLILLLLFFLFQVLGLLLALFLSGQDVAGLMALAQGTASPDYVALGRGMCYAEAILAAGVYVWYRLSKKRSELDDNVADAIHDAEEAVRRHSNPSGAFQRLMQRYQQAALKARRTCPPLRHQLRATVALLCVALGLNCWLSPLGLDDAGSTAIFEAQSRDAVCLLLLCVVGPLAEELIFRAGITRILLRRGLTPLMAAALAAFCFGIFHGNLLQGIPAFLVGILLGLFFCHSGNLTLCLPAHIANNTLAVVLMYFPAIEAATADLSPALLLPLGALLFCAGLWLARPFVKKALIPLSRTA